MVWILFFGFMSTTNRLQRLQQIVIDQNLDALFVSNQSNVTYLTGFTGLSPHEREGFLFVTKSNAYLLTFPTYFGMYKDGGDGFTSQCITADKRISDHLAEIIKKEHIEKIGCEVENLTLAEHASLTQKLGIPFQNTSNIIETLRIRKDPQEIGSIRKAARLTDNGFRFIQSKMKKGVSEKELAFELEFFFKKNGADIAFFPIVAFDQNAAIPHYMPNNKQQITNNNLILLDFGARVDGYCSDMTRVIFWGTPSSHQQKIYETVKHAQQLALEILKPNLSCSLPDEVAKKHIISRGFPVYPHGLGHGVGLDIHEAPRLRSGSSENLQTDMVVTIEPGIYLEGDCGVRIEDLVVLTETGIEILSKSSKDITILE